MSALIALLLFAPLPALANQPPGPVPALSLLSLLVLLPVITALAGGYAALRAMGKAPSRWRIAATIVAVLFAAAHEGNALLVTAFVGLVALQRAGQLCWYAWQARRGAPALANASPRRLLAGGLVLAAITPLLLTASIALSGFWPEEARALDGLRRLLAEELAAAELRAGEGGRPRFVTPTREGKSLRFPEGLVFPGDGRNFRTEVTARADGADLLVEATPRNFPFAPFHLLVTLPSFRGDASGTIRAIRTHEEGARCPPDAPIVHRLTDEERAEGRRTLSRRQPP